MSCVHVIALVRVRVRAFILMNKSANDIHVEVSKEKWLYSFIFQHCSYSVCECVCLYITEIRQHVDSNVSPNIMEMS